MPGTVQATQRHSDEITISHDTYINMQEAKIMLRSKSVQEAIWDKRKDSKFYLRELKKPSQRK